MSLTSTEEALVRQLLDQQAAILSLAGNEATITSKLGATKVTLADLVAASSVADADMLLMRQGTNDKSVTPLLLKSYAQDGMATQKSVQAGDYNTSVAGGTADAITGDYTPNVLALEDDMTLFVRAIAANATTTPTFSPDGLIAKTIVKGAGSALAPGDIAGAGHWLALKHDKALSKFVLLNPATGIYSGLREVSSVPAQKIAPLIIVTQPHTRMMIWSGAQYVRAPWHQPCQLFYSYDNPASIPGALPVRADVSYQQSNYPDLAARLGLSGNGTFTLAEARGEFIRVLDNGRGVDTWRAIGSWQGGQNQWHQHSGTTSTSGEHSHAVSIPSKPNGGGAGPIAMVDGTSNITGYQTYNTVAAGSHTHTFITSAEGGNEARPRNVAYPLWITY